MGKATTTNKNQAFQRFKDTSAIDAAINSLCNRVKCTLTTPTISYTEMLRLIAPEEHVRFLLDCRKIAEVGRYAGRDSGQHTIARHRGKEVAIEFSVSGDENTPVMPSRMLWLDWFPDNRELAVELMRCAYLYADVAIDWGLVKTVFKYLNSHCRNPAQVHYLWPCITGIMSVNNDLDGLRQEIAPRTIPRDLPRLPPEVRALCRTTAATVALALMLPPLELEARREPNVRVTYTVDSGASVVCRDVDGDGVYTYPLN